MTVLFASFAFITIAAYAALSDLSTRRVANAVNGSLLVSGLLLQVAVLGPKGLVVGFAGAALGLALLLLPFARRWVGGGDVKFLAAAGAGLGPAGVFIAALLGLFLGGVWAVVLTVKHPELRREVASNLKLAIVSVSEPDAPRRERAQVIPLCVPLSVASVLVLCAGGSL